MMGSYHKDTNGENQDTLCHAKNKQHTVISLADGVSSCRMAKTGAMIAGEAINDLFAKKGEQLLTFPAPRIAEFTLSHVLYRLKEQAAKDGVPFEEYASTLALVLINSRSQKGFCFSLGDSLILGVENGGVKVLAAPSDSTAGCYVTTTGHAEDAVVCKVFDTGSMESVMICSDGAWRQMYVKNQMKQDVKNALIEKDFDQLQAYLCDQMPSDDSSFIAIIL